MTIPLRQVFVGLVLFASSAQAAEGLASVWGALPAPAGLTVTAPAEGRQTRLTWNAVAAGDLAGYVVYRASFVGAGLQAGPVVRVVASKEEKP